MQLVFASLVALAVGPVLVTLARGRGWVLSLIDGFVVVTIGGIVLLHILPHAFLVGGGVTLVLAAVGLLGPALFERVVGPRLPLATRWMLPAVLVGMALHAMIDGAVLVDPHEHQGHEHGAGGMVALGVVLHRVPEGLAIWWLFRKRFGPLASLLAVVVIGASTALGSALGEHIEGFLGTLHGVQAFVAGSLLHVIFHRSHDLSVDDAARPDPGAHACELDLAPPVVKHDHDHDDAAPGGAGPAVIVESFEGRELRLAAAAGALAGVGLLWVVSLAHPASKRIASEIGMGTTFVTLALESAPGLLLSYLVVGLAHAFWPNAASRWLSGGSALGQSLRALALAPVVPVCSCGVLPIYQGLIARSVPAAAAMTLLVAAPEIGLTAFFLSVSLLGSKMAAVRLVAALGVAVLVGVAVGRHVPSTDAQTASERPQTDPSDTLSRLRGGMAYAGLDVVDRTLPWIILGLGVAAFLEPSLGLEALPSAAGWYDVPLFALLGIPLYICASGATPLVAVLLHKGLSAGAALAFLLTGPAANLMTFGVLSRLHGGRVAWLFALALFAAPTALGYLVNASIRGAEPVALHAAAHSAPDPLSTACLAVLVLLALASLVRRGPRFWVEQVIAPGHQHEPAPPRSSAPPAPAAPVPVSPGVVPD